MDRKTLLNIFLQQKDELTQKVAQAVSVKNIEGVRLTIARFFDTQLSPSGEYASQLTQVEFFIMQSSIFVNELQKKLDEQFMLKPEHVIVETVEAKAKVTSTPMAFAYSVIGGLLGTWAGAPLAGTIAGLALSVLLYKHQPRFITKHKYSHLIIAKKADDRETTNKINYLDLNTPEIMKVFEEICVGIDDMMQVVSNQTTNSFTQPPKPKQIPQELDPILRECQKHIGLLHKAGMDADSIGIFEDVWLAVGVEFVHFSEENRDYFIEKTNQSINGISEQYPAVLINGKLHLQGLILTPENK